MASFRVWQQQHVQSEIFDEVRTDYQVAIEEGDAKDAKKQIELLLEQTNVPVPIHVENLKNRLKLAERMIELADTPKLSKFAFHSYINALIDREIVSIQHEIPDNEVRMLLQDQKNDPQVVNNELTSLALVGESFASTGAFITEKNLRKRQQLRDRSFETFNAALESCPTNNDELALRLSTIVDLINGHATTAEGLPYAETFIDKYDSTNNILIRSAINDKKFGLKRTSLMLPEFLSSLADQRESIIQKILITLNDAASTGKVDRAAVETGVQRVYEMIRLGYYQPAKQLSRRLRAIGLLDESNSQRLDRYDAIVELYESRPFQFDGIVDSTGTQIRLTGTNPKNRLLLFVSAASEEKSQELYSQLVRAMGSKSENTKLSLVYVDRGKTPGGLRRMRKFARSTKSVTVWFVRLAKSGAIDVPQEHFIKSFPFLIVLDSENRIIAADPPFENILEFLQ